jgi:hypothetical protein
MGKIRGNESLGDVVQAGKRDVLRTITQSA